MKKKQNRGAYKNEKYNKGIIKIIRDSKKWWQRTHPT